MLFQRNTWYVAAHPKDIDRQLQRRIILNDPILLYRAERGQIVAIEDRCPHRFAPLSRGTLFGDVVQCKYHGLRFDSSGHCVLNPHGNVIAPHNRVRSFPVEERHGLVWIWMGNPEGARADTIPDLSYMTSPKLRTAHAYINPEYRYDILVDNLLDLSHGDYLHAGSFMGGACERSETLVSEDGNDVIVNYIQWRAPAPPSIPGLPDTVNQSFKIRWHPGQVITFEYRVTPLDGDLESAAPFRFAHIATPEGEHKTHYFISFTRDYALDDPENDARASEQRVAVVENEDNPMLRAVDVQMAGRELMEMRPVILPTDRGALAVRRKMQKLINAETAKESA